MKMTRNLLASAVAASVATAAMVPAHADIELGNGLTVTGFVDMSFFYEDVDVDGAESSQEFNIDQVETSFLYAGSDGISAQVDIQYGQNEDSVNGASFGGEGGDVDVDSNSTTFVEQAFITKDFGGGFSVKGGRFLSYSGWEAAEPTGLYQYSGTGYGGLFYGGYQQGVSAMYDTDSVDFMFSAVNSAFDPNDGDNENISYEAGIALTPSEGLTAKLFYIAEQEMDVMNFWTSYETGSLTFAFEYSQAESDEAFDFGAVDELLTGIVGPNMEADGYLLMANYAAGDFGITFRYHSWATEGDGIEVTEKTGMTLAPSLAVGDNLLMVLEFRQDENEFPFVPDGAADYDVTSVALEALFTF